MTRRSFSREFKQEAVELITKCGVSTAEASRDLKQNLAGRVRRLPSVNVSERGSKKFIESGDSYT